MDDSSFRAEIRTYLYQRFRAIDARMQQAFRYVDLHSANARTFSYEFSSLLTDSGRTFASVMDRLERQYGQVTGDHTHFDQYRDRLRQSEPDIHFMAAFVTNASSGSLNKVYPFEAFGPTRSKLVPTWWTAYGVTKHAESEESRRRKGNLRYAFSAFCGLAVLVGHPRIVPYSPHVEESHEVFRGSSIVYVTLADETTKNLLF